MAAPDTRKILRIGVIQGGTIIEERLLRKRESVTVGSAFKNTFSLAAGGAPASYPLFEVRGGEYFLNFEADMKGRVSVGSGVHTLASLRENGRAQRHGKGWTVALDERSRGKVELADVIFLFQFVAPPPARPAPKLPVALRGGPLTFLTNAVELSGTFGVSLLLSMLLQVGFVTYLVLEVPPPPRPTGVSDLPDEIRMILREAEEEPVEVAQENNEDAEAVAESAVEEAPAEAEPEEQPEEQPREANNEPRGNDEPQSREVQLQVARERAREASVFGALVTSENGDGGVMDQVLGISDRRVEHLMARQRASGGEGGIARSSGSTGSADPSGEGDTVAVEVGGGRTREAAEQVESGGERERVRVEANIRQSTARTAGSGRLDSDYLDRVLRQRVRDIRRCYERVLPDNPDLSGRLVVQFTVGASGRVDDVSLPENEVGAQVGDCVEGRVRRWRFDPPEGGSVTVRKTYILEPGGG